MNNARTILIVDDDKPYRFMLSVILNSWGYHTRITSSVSEVHKILHEQQVDMVMLDISGARGFDTKLVSKIKGHMPQTPLILMTAYSPADSILELKKMGVVDVLTKPFELEALEEVLLNTNKK